MNVLATVIFLSLLSLINPDFLPTFVILGVYCDPLTMVLNPNLGCDPIMRSNVFNVDFVINNCLCISGDNYMSPGILAQLWVEEETKRKELEKKLRETLQTNQV